MRPLIQACGAVLVLGFLTAAGCGGSVLVDGPGGEGGSGGSGNQGGATSSSGPTTTGGPSTTTSTATSTSVTTSVTSSTSTGPMKYCDDTGFCGDPENGCIGCSLSPDTGPCWPSWNVCMTSDECVTYIDCIQGCAPDDGACYQKCFDVFPTGAQQYQDLVICVICGACYNDCDGAASGCP